MRFSVLTKYRKSHSIPGDSCAAAGAVPLPDHHGDGAGEERIGAAVGGARQEEEGQAVEAAPVGNKGDQAEGESAAHQRIAKAQQGMPWRSA